MPPAKF